MAMIRWIGVTFVGLSALLTASCGGESDVLDRGEVNTCLSQCQEAQVAECTTVKDCNGLCGSAPLVAEKSGCTDAWSGYDACATSVTACDIDMMCKSDKGAFIKCGEAYCSSHQGDADCAAVASAL